MKIGKILSKDSILSANDTKTTEVNVPEWGGVVLVKVMSGFERDSFEQAVTDMQGKNVKVNMKNIRARLCVLTIVDNAGKRMFSDADIQLLGDKSSLALDRIFEVARKLNGLTESDVEQLAKN